MTAEWLEKYETLHAIHKYYVILNNTNQRYKKNTLENEQILI